MSTLKEILAAFDDQNPALWTDDGEPRLSIVQKAMRDDTVTRADIALTGRVRTMVSREIPLTPEAAAIAADEAEAAAIAAREKVAVTKVVLKQKRKAQSNAIMIFNGLTPKRDVADLVRENSAREIARKMAIIDGTAEPDASEYVAPASHLDAVMSSGAKGSSVNRGWRRQPGRLPSQR
jgi:hypothetical protein